MLRWAKRLVVGRPMRSDRLGETLLPKKLALPVAAGVANIVSAFPGLAQYAVPICIGMVAVLAIANLRGVRESGTVFAVPTYGFIAMIFVMLGWALVKALAGNAPVAESAHL